MKARYGFDVFCPVCIAGERAIPVEFFFGIDCQKHALAKTRAKGSRARLRWRFDH